MTLDLFSVLDFVRNNPDAIKVFVPNGHPASSVVEVLKAIPNEQIAGTLRHMGMNLPTEHKPEQRELEKYEEFKAKLSSLSVDGGEIMSIEPKWNLASARDEGLPSVICHGATVTFIDRSTVDEFMQKAFGAKRIRDEFVEYQKSTDEKFDKLFNMMSQLFNSLAQSNDKPKGNKITRNEREEM